MKNQQSSVRFDHREIAVVFSLFIFVSLLMFTVGILVGKGLQQAKYEGQGGPNRSIATPGATPGAHGDHSEAPKMDAHTASVGHPGAGTSITTGHDEHPANKEHDDHGASPGLEKEPGDGKDLHAEADPHAPPKNSLEDELPGHHAAVSDEPATLEETESSLDLVPAHPKKDKFAAIDEFPKSKESEKVLKDPKMAKYLEGGAAPRAVASLPPGQLPKSFAQGKYTVQVGSYPNQREAVERVEALKKQGFPFAYYSAKQIDAKRGTWFRVWLGYFPDATTAKQGGEHLLSRGEVSSYFVRTNENEG